MVDLGHVAEVHAVDAGDERGRHEDDGGDGEDYDVTGQVTLDMGVGSIAASMIAGEDAGGSGRGYSASIGATVAAGEQLSFSGVYTMTDGRYDYYTMDSDLKNTHCEDEDEACSAISLGAAYTTGDFKFSAGYAIQSVDEADVSLNEARASVAWSATPKLSIVGQLVKRTSDDYDTDNIAGVGAWFKF